MFICIFTTVDIHSSKIYYCGYTFVYTVVIGLLYFPGHMWRPSCRRARQFSIGIEWRSQWKFEIWDGRPSKYWMKRGYEFHSIFGFRPSENRPYSLYGTNPSPLTVNRLPGIIERSTPPRKIHPPSVPKP